MIRRRVVDRPREMNVCPGKGNREAGRRGGDIQDGVELGGDFAGVFPLISWSSPTRLWTQA